MPSTLSDPSPPESASTLTPHNRHNPIPAPPPSPPPLPRCESPPLHWVFVRTSTGIVPCNRVRGARGFVGRGFVGRRNCLLRVSLVKLDVLLLLSYTWARFLGTINRSFPTSALPVALIRFSPFGVSGRSVIPVWRPLRDHSVSPWRIMKQRETMLLGEGEGCRKEVEGIRRDVWV